MTNLSLSKKRVVARVYLVRHGETQANRDGIIQGQQDTQLNALGEEQARIVGEVLKEEEFGFAFSSDLMRARKTAEAIVAHHSNVELVLHKELRERGMGDMEGKEGRTKGAKLALAHDKTVEAAGEFSHRIVGWWNRVILGQVLSRQKGSDAVGVLVATHGGVITTLVRELVGSRKVRSGDGVIIFQCMNASISVIEVDEDGKGELVRFGDVAHLRETRASDADIL